MEIPGAGRHGSSSIWHRGQDAAAPISSQASSSRPAGAASSSFFGRELPEGQLGVIVAASALCIGLGLWCMKKIKEHAAAAERSAHPSKIDIDWVEAGAVSPIVRKQNGCDCCWAMAAVASVEAVHYLKTMQSISLSVQELIDCDTTNNGCKTGNSDRALRYIQQNGISSESSYPYMARRSLLGCKKDRKVTARISGFRYVDCNEDALEKAVAKQPVVVRLQYTTDLWNYKGGIMDYEAFPPTTTDEGHFVLIVGYGTSPDGIKYWRFKNSWEEGWGESGFGRIRRHVADKLGVLGMFMYKGVYPVLDT